MSIVASFPFRRAGVLLAIALFGVGTARAQFSIVSISRNQQPIPVAKDIQWLKTGTLQPVPLTSGAALSVDDEITSTSSAVIVEARCLKSTFSTQGPFRMVVISTTGGPCMIRLGVGTVDVIGDSPSGVQLPGGAIAGAKATMYRVSVGMEGKTGDIPGKKTLKKRVLPDVTVFEGEVEVSAPGITTQRVFAGAALLSEGNSYRQTQISEAVIAQAADFHARADLSALALPAEQHEAALTELRNDYLGLLQATTKPDSSTPTLLATARITLAASQVRFGAAPNAALYHLRKAAGADTANGERAATVAWLSAAALQTLGDSVAANRAYANARRLDPKVEARIRTRYRVVPAQVRAPAQHYVKPPAQ